MDSIDKAIEDIKSHKSGEQWSYRGIAKKHGVARETLRRLHQEISLPREEYKNQQRKINPQQELELVKYIEKLTARRLSPTREMIQNFASAIAKTEISKSWVTRFINRNRLAIEPHWAPAMDRVRHQTDSEEKYRQFFQLLAEKIEEYNIKLCNTYNMDEKGFLIGVLGRSKRIFSKAMWDSKEVRTALQDGNREWITLLACICGDGTALPPAILFAAANKVLQSAWVEDIKVLKHQVFVSSSPNGWATNDIGLAWLEQVFNRYTKAKAGRSWRLLILDGHGSHVTMDFINYCDRNRILLLVFPPHSTHTLQPLDVVMFKPLSTAYSNALTKHLHNAQGLVSVKKGDFFRLFWQAWQCFREDLIHTAFRATGIWPLNPEAILRRFTYSTPEQEQRESSSDSSVLSVKNWQKTQTLVRSTAKEESSRDTQKILRSLHHLTVQVDLLRTENKGLQEALLLTQKHKKKSKPLDLQQRQEYHGGAVFWSPKKIREAQARERVREQEEEEQQREKARIKAQRELNRQRKLEEQEKNRLLRIEKARERERIKAEREAVRQAKKQNQNNKRSIQPSQRRKRKTLETQSNRQKRQKRAGGGSAEGSEMGVAARAVSPPPPPTTRRGREINLPRKYK